jgi:hypothetical protein
MVFFNYATMQMAAKIVYYGPGLCGKTTNLQYIYQKTSPKSRGEMVSLETETDRTLFFDLLPLDVGNIAGFKTRFQLYTVPGQVFYNSTRKLVLRGVDGIVFVADSQVPMMEANVESLNNLKANLAELGYNLDEIPLVFQYNKRDLKNIALVDELNGVLNPRTLPFFEASAIRGDGVFETLKGVSKTTLITLRKRALGEERLKVPEAAPRPAPEKPKVATPVPAAVRPVTPVPVAAIPIAEPQPAPLGSSVPETRIEEPAPSPAAAAPEPGIVSSMPAIAEPPAEIPAGITKPGLPTAAEIATEKVEFAQVVKGTSRPAVKKISVSTSDIAAKLDSLRDLYTGKLDSPKAKKKQATAFDPLSALLESTSKEKKITKTLKISLSPEELQALKNLSVDFHLSGESVRKQFPNLLTIHVDGQANPKRVTLEIKLEIAKK